MTTQYNAYAGRVLKVDLTTKKVSHYPWTDSDREMFLGGKIMAAKIIYDIVSPEVEPLSSGNIMVISTGPLTGTGAPSSSRFNISSLSPLTNLLASSNCGGDFGIHLKKAGYDALIITGASENKVWVEINEDEVIFHEADDLWGMKITESQEILNVKAGKCGKVVIGPAGENLVKYAGIFSQDRTAGRAGLGAVMGYKNLKAIVAKGKKPITIYNKELLKPFYKKWIKKIRNHPMTGKFLPQYGTAGILTTMQKRKCLATRNFKYGQFDKYLKVCGETFLQTRLVKSKGCITCPIKCGRVVEIDGKNVKGPELETLGLLGPNLENHDLDAIIRWNYQLDELGMDTISTGGTIAFAMELNEKGLWDNGLEFGKIDNLSNLFEDIAYRRGIGNELAEGTRLLSNKYGGKDFAINSKGLELSAYEPRSSIGLGLGYAVSNRGACHLNGGYVILLENIAMKMDRYSKRSKAELTAFFQNIMEATSSAGNCLFTLYPMLPKFLVKNTDSKLNYFVSKLVTLPGVDKIISIFNRLKENSINVHLTALLPQIKAIEIASGMKMSFGKFRLIGERGYVLERMFNIERGVNSKEDILPVRLSSVLQDPNNPYSKVPVEDLKQRYYKSRGWNEKGIPTDKTLSRLKLDFTINNF